jgi:hypothetical protein
VRDVKGLILTPEMSIAEAPRLNVLLVSDAAAAYGR